MKTNRTIGLLTIVACCLGIWPHMALAQGNEHNHSSHHATEVKHLKLNKGEKWKTDANLRQGMELIRDALAVEMTAIHSGKKPAAQSRELAQKVNEQIAFMVQKCNLDKDADTMLHLVLAELVSGADTISAAGDEHAMHQGITKISDALEDYAAYFEHPGWTQ